jgi:hypothetical protein
MVNTNTNYLQKKRKEIDDVPPIEVDVLPLSMDVIVDDDGGGGVQLSRVSGMTLSLDRPICNTTSADGAGAVAGSVEDPTAGTEYTATAASARTGNSAASGGDAVDLVAGTEETAATHVCHLTPIAIPRKKSKSNNGTKQKKRPPISDSDLEKQVNQVRDICGGGNIVDSSLRLTQLLDTNNDNEDDANKEVKEVTKYCTMPVLCEKSSPWWEGYELFVPVRHPTLYQVPGA